MSSNPRKTGFLLKKRFTIEELIPLFIFIGLYILFASFSSTFLKPMTIQLILQQNSAVGIIAIAMMCIIITGALDFTVGETVALAGITATKIYMSAGEHLIVMILCAIVIGMLVGLVNGLIVTKLRIKAFIATLATMSIIKGLTMIIGEAASPVLSRQDVIFIGAGNVFGFLPMPFVLLVLMIVITTYILNKTRTGLYWYAIGGNEEAARQAGVNVDKYKIRVHMYAGICSAIASLIIVSRIRTIVPNISGTLLLDGAAAAIIGGTIVNGGKGKMFGTIAGVFIIALISTALTFFNVPSVFQTAVKGGFILVSLLINSTIGRISEKRRLEQ